jgi:sugar lactone lactonase YvrE
MSGRQTRLALALVAALSLALLLAAPAAARTRFDTKVLAHVGSPGYPALSLVAPDRTIYVGTFENPSGIDSSPSKVFAYSPAGKLLRTYVVQGQTPGAAHGVQVAAIDRHGILYLLDQDPARVVTLDPRTGKQATYGTFRDVQPCIPGMTKADCGDTVMDNSPTPDYAAWGTDGGLYVTDYTQGLIWRVPAGGGTAHVWFTDPRLDGTQFGPAGIVMMPDRRTLLVSTSGGGATSPDATTGELYRLPIQPNGRPGALQKLWESGPIEAPDGFALARSGNVYMALVGPNVNQLVVISPTGQELTRFPKDNSGNNGSPVPFDEPSSVQFDGKRLIVTNLSFIAGDPSHFVIFDVFAGEIGAPVFVPGRKSSTYALSVEPRRVAAGANRTFHFHASLGKDAVAGALVSFAGQRVRTGKHGNATIAARFSNAGKRRATLSVGAPQTTVATTTVTVTPAPSGGGGSGDDDGDGDGDGDADKRR